MPPSVPPEINVISIVDNNRIDSFLGRMVYNKNDESQSKDLGEKSEQPNVDEVPKSCLKNEQIP